MFFFRDKLDFYGGLNFHCPSQTNSRKADFNILILNVEAIRQTLTARNSRLWPDTAIKIKGNFTSFASSKVGGILINASIVFTTKHWIMFESNYIRYGWRKYYCEQAQVEHFKLQPSWLCTISFPKKKKRKEKPLSMECRAHYWDPNRHNLLCFQRTTSFYLGDILVFGVRLRLTTHKRTVFFMSNEEEGKKFVIK